MSSQSKPGKDAPSEVCSAHELIDLPIDRTPIRRRYAGSWRVEVMHGVNLDMLGRRDPAHYGTITLAALERRISEWARELALEVRFLQTNAEHEFVEHLHGLPDLADAVILNPGAWTHYSWAIHDALQLTGLPAIEVHLSDVHSREPWRRLSVIGDLCLASISGEGPGGYRLALQRLREALDGSGA